MNWWEFPRRTYEAEHLDGLDSCNGSCWSDRGCGREVEELELAQFLDDVMCWLGSSRAKLQGCWSE
jgi:hypothetical protein